MRLFLIYLFVCCSVYGVRGQVFTASTSASDVYTGQAFDVSYRIEDTRKGSFEAPNFSPFTVVSGPFTSRSQTIVNGSVSSSTTYSYRLISENIGQYTIPPATLKVQGKILKSNSLKVNVIKATKENMLAGDEMFLEMTKSDSIVYVGQQLLLDHSIYHTNQKISGVSLISEFPKDRFLINRIRNASDAKVSQVLHDGKILNKVDISRLGLFPLRSGTLHVPKTTFEISIQKNQGRTRGFFSFFESESKYVSAEAFELEVKPLPNNTPATFTGIVGKLNIKLVNDPNQQKGQEEHLVRAIVQGNGIADQFEFPTFEDDNFKIYEAKSVGNTTYILDGEIYFKKIFQLLIVPNQSGKLPFSVPYSYFDPKTEKYVTKRTNNMMIDSNMSEGVKEDATQKTIDITGRKSSKSTNTWLAAAGIVCLAGALLYGFFSIKNKKQKPTPETKSVEVLAKEVAIEKLSGAKLLLDNNDTNRYWETLEDSIRIYLEERLNIPPKDFGKQRVKEEWNSHQLSETTYQEWESFNNKINLARYAGQDISHMEDLYHQALDWIQRVEKESHH